MAQGAASTEIGGDEASRLAEVLRYDILDTPPDGAFDRIASLAALLLDAPIAIVSIVDADRIWFKSHHGTEVAQVGRDPGLCASAILQDEPWVIENAAIDPRALTNPLVAGQLGLRAYAGAQLRTRGGHNLGTLCVLDRKPRRFTADHIRILKELAAVVVSELEVRLAARRAVAAITSAAASASVVQKTEGRLAGRLSDREREVLEALSQGLSNDDIARRLFVTTATVKSHVASIYRKLGVTNRVQASTFVSALD